MRRVQIVFICLLILLGLLPQALFAQESATVDCFVDVNRFTWTHPTYAPRNTIIRYEAQNQRLLLVSWNTGEIIRELETSLAIWDEDYRSFDWSPRCDYIYGTVQGDVVIWDALNGGRVNTFTDITPKDRPYWNREGNNLILEAYGGSFLWNFTNSTPMLLTFDQEIGGWGYSYFDWQVEWDNQRNQVLVAPNFAGGRAVIAYDQTTAQQVASFNNYGRQAPVKFNITPDNRYVIVFTSEREAFPSYTKGITVWDRDTMQYVTVDANSMGAALNTQVTLSPDGRYLVLARIGTMRVWDLAGLSESVEARDPIYRHRIDPDTQSIQFVGESVVETADVHGRRVQWDLHSGTRLN